MLYGEVADKTLKELAEQVRRNLTSMDNVTQVDVAGIRSYEVSIEVSEENMRRYGLSFDEVAKAVRQSSLDIPGGSVKTAGGEILVRTKGQRYTGPEFEEIIVLTRRDGTKIRLKDIANVVDGFDDSEISSRFDGQKAVLVKVFRIAEQSALDIADTVNDYVETKASSLPAGVSISAWQDSSVILRSRMDLLKRNGLIGLILVFCCLNLFLDFRLAFWTTMGIPISFLGGFWLMPLVGVSLNMISLFAFIMVLGIVVDDAIVVGENIFNYRQTGMDPVEASIKGVKEMAAPVTLAVLTTIFAFVPLLYISGVMGKILSVIPLVVICVLAVSLVEAIIILPAHLSGKRVKLKTKQHPLEKVHGFFGKGLERFVNGRFANFSMFTVRWRYATIACAIAILFVTVGLIGGGYIKVTFIDSVEADNMLATVKMPQGTPVDETLKVVKVIEAAAYEIQRQVDAERQGQPSIYKHIATTIGDWPGSKGGGPVRSFSSTSSAHLAEVNIELLAGQDRGDISSVDLMNRWRKLVGEIPGVASLNFVSEMFTAGEAINVELSHEDMATLIAAADDLKKRLREYDGTSDISDSFEPGKVELRLAIKDEGRVLGLTLSDVARQVRQGFYGEEAQRIQRGRHDVRIMIRYPEANRRSIADIENMRIRLPSGTEIPFRTVADIEYGRGYATIRRADRARVVNVTSDVNEEVANSAEINSNLVSEVLPDLMANNPGLNYRFAGEQRERQESFASMFKAFPIALMAIYGLLAMQFRSYVQPLIVMSAIPFGIVGATFGHVFMGFNLGLLSLFGIVALSGVVVNDSLIMIDLINRERAEGIALAQVVRDSVTRRFRPIMLTTLTTFFGLVPMLMEKSLQARFLIPMAISLAFGVAFATMITLVLVPCLYMILEDVKSLLGEFAGLFINSNDQKD
jgi:multidrug efflux pump subunit AcrB